MGDAVRDLQANGLKNPLRVRRLIEDALSFHRIDLKGFTVFTEVGSGNYVTTPMIAAMAGSEQVFAITRDSGYGSAREIEGLAYRFAEFCGVRGRIKVVFEKTEDAVGEADIVTNLGFVRPIDGPTVAMMKRGAVVPLMCEAWEFREGDVDLEACRGKDIVVIGTNEDCPGLEVFDFSGPLCMKMLFEAEIEIYKSRIAVVSTDKFGVVIERFLKQNRAEVTRFESLALPDARGFLERADALVIADYRSRELFIGAGGQMEAEALQVLAPGITVIAFAGLVDAGALERVAIPCFPHGQSRSVRMSRTLAHLGPRPVVELHSAGLKVAEQVLRVNLEGLTEVALRERVGAMGQVVVGWTGR